VKATSLIRRAALTGLTVLTAAAMVAPSGVAANDADVIRTGDCSNSSDWKLKLSPENGKIEVEFEVDTPRAGRTWSIRMFQNGTRFFIGNRTTDATGEIHVRFLRPNTAGTDTFKAKAINLANGATCIGQASF